MVKCPECQEVINPGDATSNLGGEIYHWLCVAKMKGDITTHELRAIYRASQLDDNELRKQIVDCILDPTKLPANRIAVPFMVNCLSREQILDLMVHIRKEVTRDVH